MGNQAKAPDPNGVTHITPADGSVFEDLGFDKVAAKEMQAQVLREIEQRNDIKRAMVDGLKQEIARRGLSAEAAAALLDISRPRLSDITQLKVDKFSIDCVSDLMTRMGQTVRVVIDASPSASLHKAKAKRTAGSN